MAIWKARTANGVRAYFKVVRTGILSTGLATGLFNALLINPQDTANQALTVAESTQQAGVYYVDIPGAFLTTHGAGHYGLSIGIHKPNPQKIDDEILMALEVTDQDLDDLASTIYVGQKIV